MSSIPTVAVTARVYDQSGNPAQNAIVTMRLSTTERYQGYVVPKEVSAKTDVEGKAILNVFPNELGSEGSEYRVTIQVVTNSMGTATNCYGSSVSKTIKGYATVPNADCDLQDIMELPTSDPRGSGQVITAEVAGYASQAASARDAAESHAQASELVKQGVDAALVAANAAKDTALIAQDSAQTQALAAKASADKASQTVDTFETTVLGQVESKANELIADATNAITATKVMAVDEITDTGASVQQEVVDAIAGVKGTATRDIASLGEHWKGEVEKAGTLEIEKIKEEGELFIADMDLKLEEATGAAKQAMCSSSAASASASDASSSAQEAKHYYDSLKDNLDSVNAAVSATTSAASKACACADTAEVSMDSAKIASASATSSAETASIHAQGSLASSVSSSNSATMAEQNATLAKTQADRAQAFADDVEQSLADAAGAIINDDVIAAAVAVSTQRAEAAADSAEASKNVAEQAIQDAQDTIVAAQTAVNEANEAVTRAETTLKDINDITVQIREDVAESTKQATLAKDSSDRSAAQAIVATNNATLALQHANNAEASKDEAAQLLEDAQSAVTAAEDAIVEANTAISNAQLANSAANTAIDSANAAKTAVDAAVVEAQNAVTAAQGAVANAQEAVNQAQDQVDIVESAVSVAQGHADRAETAYNDTVAAKDAALASIQQAVDTGEAALENTVTQVSQDITAAKVELETLGDGYVNQTSQNYLLAKAWAESATPPDINDSTSKSAKSWAEEAKTASEGLDVIVGEIEDMGDRQVSLVREAVFTSAIPSAAPDYSKEETLLSGTTSGSYSAVIPADGYIILTGNRIRTLTATIAGKQLASIDSYVSVGEAINASIPCRSGSQISIDVLLGSDSDRKYNVRFVPFLVDYLEEADPVSNGIFQASIDALEAQIPTVPTVLPNPHALTINGTVYDGSVAKTVNISGGDGSGTAVQYIPQELTPEQIAQVMANLNQGFMPIDPADLPADYPTFTVTGESPYPYDFYFAPRVPTGGSVGTYLSILNHKGQVLKYIKTAQQSWCFRKAYNSRGEVRYTYLQNVTDTDIPGMVTGGLGNTELVVMDASFNIIDTTRLLADAHVAEGQPVDNHDYMFIDDGHYIVGCYYLPEGATFRENHIQEIQYGKVIWSLNSLDYPEMHDWSHTTTQNGTDYNHHNSFVFTPDGNLVVSYRQIGIIKFNRATKEIMWVIGRLRNDFKISAGLLPYQQHDCKFVRKDGAFTIFDNAGHGTKSRVLKYKLNEETMTATVEEFVMSSNASGSMGSATLVDLENQVFDVNCGGGFWYFEEYDFKNSTELMKVTFDNVVNGNKDMYRVWRDTPIFYSQIPYMPIPVVSSVMPPAEVVDKTALQQEIAVSENLTESNYTTETWTVFATALASAKTVEADSNATQAQVNSATSTLTNARNGLVVVEGVLAPIYSIQDQTFDGTRYVDTNIKLFDTNKSFSIVTRRQPSYEAYITNNETMSFMSCWDEAGVKGIFTLLSNYREELQFNPLDVEFDLRGDTWRDNILSITYDSVTGTCKVKVEFIEEGRDNLSFEGTVSYSQLSNNLLIGTRGIDAAGTLGQYYKGTVKHFQVYDKALTDAELTAVIDSL